MTIRITLMTMAGLAALSLGIGACAAKPRSGAGGVALDCQLSGAGASPLGQAEFCALLRDSLAKELNRPVVLATLREAAALRDRVEVRLSARPQRLRANVVATLRGKRVTVPELGVNVIDRTLVRMDCNSIAGLVATEVARLQS